MSRLLARHIETSAAHFLSAVTSEADHLRDWLSVQQMDPQISPFLPNEADNRA